MSTAVAVESRIKHAEVTDETINAYLVDGRVISARNASDGLRAFEEQGL